MQPVFGEERANDLIRDGFCSQNDLTTGACDLGFSQGRFRRAPFWCQASRSVSLQDPCTSWRPKAPTMKSLSPCAKAFLASDDGATGVEFSIMIALLFGACIAVIKTLATVGIDQF